MKLPKNLWKWTIKIFWKGVYFWINNSDIIGKRVNQDFVISPIAKQFPKQLFPTEGDYVVLSKERLEIALKLNFAKNIKWTKNRYDCDDYAFFLAGLMRLVVPDIAFGYAQTKTHAFNLAVLDNRQVVIIEPQSNQILSPHEYKFLKKYSPFELVVI